ncbi:MAG: hypothetical protein AAFO04_27460 [Cyanobacteria bacterium J06592_8]
MYSILIIYFVGGFIAFCVWFSVFIQDSSTPLTESRSWIVLLLATILWPITVPASFVELFKKERKLQPELRPVSSSNALPLGYLLRVAGLLSESQVSQALEVQKASRNSMRIGEIIASYGWLQQETIDFFANALAQNKTQPQKRIGEYLKSAKLLNEQQVRAILDEQRQTDLRFGEIAVMKGWVKPETVNFILDYLQEQSLLVPSY